ncbi:TonB-dependent receptor plug domain-containing protein [Parasediminibacterium sp. JCM 36343]|uniref:TonB-dependent receptor plug domain-containing protein n=1 Tax=Parasediminibacterium sp. JCM 36343 TaxID=3374279 RepID=UPI0039782392
MGKKITLLSTALLTATALLAQQDTVTNNLDEVVVTANKLYQKQSTTGKVITVISKEQLEKSTGKTVAQVLNEQAGIVVNGALNTAGSVQTVYMRGANSGRVLLLLDGIPIGDPSEINNNFDLNLFSINDVERIEVCKGAQSTLYGSDAVAGVINIISLKSGITKPINVKATVAGGKFNTYKGNVQVYGKADKLTYTARYSKIKTDGFSTAYDSSGKKEFDKDGYDGNMANASVQYQATSQLLVKAFTMYSQYRADLDAAAFGDKKNEFTKSKNLTSGAGFSYKNDAVTLVGNYQYTKTHRLYDDNYSAGSHFFSYNDYKGISQFAELYTTVKLGSGFSLLSGADYRYGSYNNYINLVSSFGPYTSTSPDTSVSQTSMYASLSFIDKKNKFILEVGGRLNTHSRYNTNYTYTFNPAFNINKQWRVFASIASGFKAPSLYQLSLNGLLLPEKSVNYEGGVQFQNKIFNTRAVYFIRHINNGIDYNTDINYVNSNFFNYVSQKVNGLEYEINIKPTDKISINANYTLLLPTEVTQNRATFKDTVSYNYLLRRPKNTINVTIGVQPLKQLYLSLSGKYVSSRYDAGGYGIADVKLDSYFILGANASYEINKYVKFFADAQNLTNKKFFDASGYNSIPFVVNGGFTLNL